VEARLRSQRAPRTAVHGDLWFGNVLAEGGSVCGVLDWETGAVRGDPLRDPVRFALAYALYLDRRTRPGRRTGGHPGLRSGRWGAGVAYALGGRGWFPGLVRGFLRASLAGVGVDPERWRDAALAGIAEVAAVADDEGFARRHLELFLELTRATSGGPA
jgi:Phosphotransferase enzyme family